MAEMFLRTAQTEARIDKLEAAVKRIEERLKLGEDDDHPDLPMPGVQPSDGGDADGGGVEQPAAIVRDVRREGDEPRVQTPSHRRKR